MRKAAGMSQEQLAELLCTKKATISAYENYRIDIKSSIVLEIAKALGCTGSYLLEGNGVITIDDRIATILSGIKSNYVKEIFHELFSEGLCEKKQHLLLGSEPFYRDHSNVWNIVVAYPEVPVCWLRDEELLPFPKRYALVKR